MSQKVKYILDEELIPTHWYNIEADLPVHTPPPVDPSTGEYMEPAKLETIFSRGAIEQEISRERYIEIPKPVREIMRQWRRRLSTARAGWRRLSELPQGFITNTRA